MNKIKLAFATLLTVTASFCLGADETALFKQLKQDALVRMWDGAVDIDGKRIQPKDSTERATVPISDNHADRIIRTGWLVGVAQSCAITWEPHYIRFMQLERKKRNLSTNQAAYIGVLFGLTQSTFAKAYAAKGPCTDEDRTEATNAIDKIGR